MAAPRKINLREAHELRQAGWRVADIAMRMGVRTNSLHAALRNSPRTAYMRHYQHKDSPRVPFSGCARCAQEATS